MAHILVVDDNRTNLDLMVYLLEAFGHVPTGHVNPLAALDPAQNVSYDLILCDILMPGIDGYEFARRLKNNPRRASVPVVAVTALAMVGDRERVLAAGFDGYIAKPIEPEMFVSQVDAYLPVSLRSAGRTNEASQTATQPEYEQGGPVVLIVDDIQTNLDVIIGALRPLGYRVLEARSVQEALRKIAHTQPALILSDVHMPEEDGFELLKAVKADPELRGIPFLFLSSTAWQTSEKLLGISLGAAKFLLRPIDPETLIEEVTRALASRRDAENSRR